MEYWGMKARKEYEELKFGNLKVESCEPLMAADGLWQKDVDKKMQKSTYIPLAGKTSVTP